MNQSLMSGGQVHCSQQSHIAESGGVCVGLLSVVILLLSNRFEVVVHSLAVCLFLLFSV